MAVGLWSDSPLDTAFCRSSPGQLPRPSRLVDQPQAAQHETSIHELSTVRVNKLVTHVIALVDIAARTGVAVA